MKYIKQIDSRRLYDDGIGDVDLFDFSHANDNEESRIEAIATVASICYGRHPVDAKKLVERLRTESGGLPSSAFEFVRNGFTHFGALIKNSLRNDPRLLTAEYRATLTPMSEMSKAHRKNIATFRIKVPIFIARQVMRHRSFSYQELSRRYTTDKQAPLEWWNSMGAAFAAQNLLMCDIYEHQWLGYQMLLKDGVPPEQARAVLGTGLYTEFWMMGDVPAWSNYFKLRLDPHTQKEHRELAVAMADLLKEHQPVLWTAVDPQGAE